MAEILGPDAGALVAPGDPVALAQAITAALAGGPRQRDATARLQARVREAFSVEAMTQAVLGAYRAALARHHG
jgi:glycosyltransferase involved in cell wall biosynthesis